MPDVSGGAIRHREQWHKEGGRSIWQYVFGMEDGLVSTLGVVSGVAAANVASYFVILAGVAAMFAGAISMAAGAYLSIKSQKEFYNSELQREIREMREMPEEERGEIREISAKKGFKGKDLDMVVKTITSDKDVWLRTMMLEELGLVKGSFDKPATGAIIMAVSFIIGAVAPIIPYVVFEVSSAIPIAVVATAVGLFILGAAKTYFTKKNWIRSGLEIVLVGLAAAAIGWFIGSLFAVPGVIV